MPIQAACPACGVPLQLPDDAVGRGFQCVRCGAGLVTGPAGQLFTQPRPAPNPFGDPPQAGQYGSGYFPSPLMTREAALARVKGPAVMLHVLGGLTIVAGLAAPLIYLVPDTDGDFAFFFTLIVAPLCLALGAFIVFCGMQLALLKSYALILSGVILVLLLGFLICPVFALPAIWPMIVLLDAGVKAHFGSKPEAMKGAIHG